MAIPVGNKMERFFWGGQRHLSNATLDRPIRRFVLMKSTWDGRRLTEIREEAGFSQADLARAIRTPTSNVSRWEDTEESGREPKATALYRISDALCVSCETLREPVGSPIKFKRKPQKPEVD